MLHVAGVLDDYVRRPRAVELVVRAVDTGDSRRGEETRRDELLIRIRLCNVRGLNIDDRNGRKDMLCENLRAHLLYIRMSGRQTCAAGTRIFRMPP